MKRTISLILLTALISTLCSCHGDGGNGNDTDVNSGDDTTTTAVDTAAVLDLPDALKYPDKTVTILTAENILSGPEELTEDLDALGKAMYERTLAVEDRFDIDLDYVGVANWKDTQNIARQSINAGSDDYQMVFTCATHQLNLVNEGLYIPIDELVYIDIEKPWWNKDYIESVSLHKDDQYILFGDITYNTIERTCCVFFNVNLLEEKLNMVPEDLYQLVYNGDWTIDKFSELVSAVYEDNGDTIKNAEDIYGLVYNGNQAYNWLAFSSGLDFTTRDEDGYPKINLNTENTVSLVEKLSALFFNNQAVYDIKLSPDFAEAFGNGKSLFCVNRFYLTGWEAFRNMTDDYGVLPMPKFDGGIEGYHSTVESLVQWGGIPITVTDPAMVSAVAEALAYESRQKTTPAYYEVTLKLKQTRDEASMDMIDMIMDGRDTDYLYINPLKGLGNIFLNIHQAGQNNFSSQYASLETAAMTALSDLIEIYENR